MRIGEIQFNYPTPLDQWVGVIGDPRTLDRIRVRIARWTLSWLLPPVRFKVIVTNGVNRDI